MNEKAEYQKPVINTDNFIGRTALAAKIYSRIGAGRPQSVSIVGDYKIGKTSLIYFLTSVKTQQKYLDNPANYIYLSFSISEKNITTLEQFIKDLSGKLSEKTALATDAHINHYDWFKKVAEKITSQGRKIIIFMDDFNIITQNENFPLEFFSFLRSMANNYNVAYVTTSYHDLQKLCFSKDVEESPFFNIFTNITLRALDENDIPGLIENEIGSSSSQQTQLLEKYAGRFPYQLKLACRVFKNLKETNSDNNFEEIFSNAFFEEIQDYFEVLFERFDPEHQKILKHFVATGRIPDNLHYLFNDLQRKDYAYWHGKRAGLYSPSFERFIRDKFNLGDTHRNPNRFSLSKILSWFK